MDLLWVEKLLSWPPRKPLFKGSLVTFGTWRIYIFRLFFFDELFMTIIFITYRQPRNVQFINSLISRNRNWNVFLYFVKFLCFFFFLFLFRFFIWEQMRQKINRFLIDSLESTFFGAREKNIYIFFRVCGRNEISVLEILRWRTKSSRKKKKEEKQNQEDPQIMSGLVFP